MKKTVKQQQENAMWRAYEDPRTEERHLRRLYKGRLPLDVRRYLRNDPEADYHEVFVLKD